MTDRYSVAEDAPVAKDPKVVAYLEAENAVRQFDAAMLELEKWLNHPNPTLRPSLILEMQRFAVEGLDSMPGAFRTAGVEIRGSGHKTPEARDVPRLVEEMCEYVNAHWDRTAAVHLAAYIMWRLNWIHPFRDGNGRTARIVSYLILCAKSGQRLPGTKTIPDHISEDKTPYYAALEAADTASKDGAVDVSQMEDLLNNLVAEQLIDIYETVSGRDVREDALTNSPATGTERAGVIGWIERHPVLIGTAVTLCTTLIALFAWLFPNQSPPVN